MAATSWYSWASWSSRSASKFSRSSVVTLPTLGRAVPSAVALLLDLGRLPGASPQVVELGPADVAPCDDLDLGNDRRVHGEGPLHAHLEAHLADGEGLLEARALAGDHMALEHLHPLAAALDHPDMHLEQVTRGEVGDVGAEARLIDDVGGFHGARCSWASSGNERG